MGWALIRGWALINFFLPLGWARWALTRSRALIRINTVACEDNRLSSLRAVLAPRSPRSTQSSLHAVLAH